MSTITINQIFRAIKETERHGLLVENVELSEFSSKKVVGVLQRLSKLHAAQRACYLEVGIFQALTLLSVAKVLVNGDAYGIDNFSQVNPKKENLAIVVKRVQQLETQNVHLIDVDCEDALENLNEYIKGKKVGVYFVDGPHDYRSQLMCLELVKPFLADNAVIVADDSNYQHVRQANRDFLVTNPQFKLLFETYTECHPNNMSKQKKEQAKEGWYNGINIILNDTDNQLQPMYPPTQRNRCFFVNDHNTHSARYAACAPEAIRFISFLLPFNIFNAFREMLKLIIRLYKIPPELKGRFNELNTFSDKLSSPRYNPSLGED